MAGSYNKKNCCKSTQVLFESCKNVQMNLQQRTGALEAEIVRGYVRSRKARAEVGEQYRHEVHQRYWSAQRPLSVCIGKAYTTSRSIMSVPPGYMLSTRANIHSIDCESHNWRRHAAYNAKAAHPAVEFAFLVVARKEKRPKNAIQ